MADGASGGCICCTFLYGNHVCVSVFDNRICDGWSWVALYDESRGRGDGNAKCGLNWAVGANSDFMSILPVKIAAIYLRRNNAIQNLRVQFECWKCWKKQ
jgi:hypothetical protein